MSAGAIVKRIFDVLISLVCLCVLSPVLLVIGLLIKLDSPGPVFFCQQRVGQNGRSFRLYKFRSMEDGAVHRGAGLFVEKNDPRITRVGRVLRRTSLDELPQLFNVLRGELSLVGPRPALPYQVAKYNQRQRRRLAVRPGVTGWAQVNGRNSLTWPQRIELDLWYAENRSFKLDLLILLKTILVLIRGEGLYNDGAPDEISSIEKR